MISPMIIKNNDKYSLYFINNLIVPITSTLRFFQLLLKRHFPSLKE